jgi:hypothetical protein
MDHGLWFFAIRGATKKPNLQCIIVSDLPIPRYPKENPKKKRKMQSLVWVWSSEIEDLHMGPRWD